MKAVSKTPIAHPRKQKSGQILVLMALMSTTLVILFGMVVSVGHIVQAKINLQNAVDLAAMSGASWQARYLNYLGLVNYRMRQNYKFTLYDLYVTQSRFNRGLRQQVLTGGTPGVFDRLPADSTTFGICQQSYGYTPIAAIGETGRAVADDTDLCKNLTGTNGAGQSIPAIVPPPFVSLNPIIIASAIAIANLSADLLAFCSDSSGQNLQYFNYIMGQLQARQELQVNQFIQVLSDFNNAFSVGSDVLASSAKADQTVGLTFLKNLIGANRAGSDISLEFINPSENRAFRFGNGGSSSALQTEIFGLNPPTGAFSEYFQRQRVRFESLFADFTPAGGCSVTIKKTPSSQSIILGLSRSRQAITDPNTDVGPVKRPFGIVLKASVTPKLLFWPTGLTPTLVAVGAAKPFGSRIAPTVKMVNTEVSGVPIDGESNQPAFANMSFYPGDVNDEGIIPGDAATYAGKNLPGVGHKLILANLLSRLPGPGPGNGRNSRRPSVENGATVGNCETSGGVLPFLCFATAPTLYEGFFWNAFPFPEALYAAQTPELISEVPSGTQSPFGLQNDLKVTEPAGYFLRDRMTNLNQSDSILEFWHHTSLIGNNGVFRDQNKPVLFADEVSTASSWTPGINFFTNAGQFDSIVTNSGGAPTGTGRRGYQIKLVSLRQICAEMSEGLSAPTGILASYCSDISLGVQN